jgi:hypothetical protein
MVTKELKNTRKVAIVEVTRDFDDAYMKITWPLGTQLEVGLDEYQKGGAIARYTAGHGVHLALFADHVKLNRAFVEKTIVETEFIKL